MKFSCYAWLLSFICSPFLFILSNLVAFVTFNFGFKSVFICGSQNLLILSTKPDEKSRDLLPFVNGSLVNFRNIKYCIVIG